MTSLIFYMDNLPSKLYKTIRYDYDYDYRYSYHYGDYGYGDFDYGYRLVVL